MNPGETDLEARQREIERRQNRLQARQKELEDKLARVAAFMNMSRQMVDNT